MTWESIVEGALRGVSDFVNSFINIIGGSLPPAAVEGLIALFAISLIYRIFQGGVKLPKIPKLKRRDDDDDEWEYVRRRRRE